VVDAKTYGSNFEVFFFLVAADGKVGYESSRDGVPGGSSVYEFSVQVVGFVPIRVNVWGFIVEVVDQVVQLVVTLVVFRVFDFESASMLFPRVVVVVVVVVVFGAFTHVFHV